MNNIEKARKEGRGFYTSIRDEDLNFHGRGLNARVGLLPIGEPGDTDAPVTAVVQVNPGPGDPLRGRHLHYGDAVNLIVDGALCMDGTWLRPGQAKIVPAHFTYGDAVPAENGCIFLEIFESHGGARPEFADARDEQYFVEVHGAVADALGGTQIKPEPGFVPRPIEITKFSEQDDSWLQTGGLWTKCVFMGAERNPEGPVCMAIKADRNISDLVASTRSFGTTTMMVVLSGSVMHDGRWMSVGDMYVAPPNEMNGDMVFGPEGAVIFFMFAKRSGIIPTFADAKDQQAFDSLLRKDAEEVASGRVERTVSVLPLRDEHVKGRAIVFDTIEAVEKYRAENPAAW